MTLVVAGRAACGRLSECRDRVFTEPHLVFLPGPAIMITVPGFNLLGDGLRDALDPRLNRN